MSKKNFQSECQRLEGLGYSLVEYEPEAKFAKYTLNGSVKIVGERK
jgi:hypothetical protein